MNSSPTKSQRVGNVMTTFFESFCGRKSSYKTSEIKIIVNDLERIECFRANKQPIKRSERLANQQKQSRVM